MEEIDYNYFLMPRKSPGPLGAKYLSNDEQKKNKKSFYSDREDIFLKGNKIKFIGEDNILLNNKEYEMTDTLYRALSRDKNLTWDDFTEEERNTYLEIADELDFFRTKEDGGFNSFDYKNIFKPLKQSKDGIFIEELDWDYSTTNLPKTGTSLYNKEYLQKKLLYLKASRAAGNTGTLEDEKRIEKYINKTSKAKTELLSYLQYLYETNQISKDFLYKLTKKITN